MIRCTFWISAREFPAVDGHQCREEPVALVGQQIAFCLAHIPLVPRALLYRLQLIPTGPLADA